MRMSRIVTFRRITHFFCLCMISLNVHAQSVSVKLQAETWDMARNGESLLKIDALSRVVNSWARNQSSKIELRYPGGEEGELWVEELRNWLISLGVPSDAIRLSPGSDAEDVINIELIEAVKDR